MGRKVKTRLWPLALAMVLGAVLGSGSMATYLYLYQVKVEANAVQIEKLDQRTKQLERRHITKPAVVKKKPTAATKKWWQVWKKDSK